jgi:hypothetical protein
VLGPVGSAKYKITDDPEYATAVARINAGVSIPDRLVERLFQSSSDPTFYRPEYCKIAKDLYERRATDLEVAQILRVNVSTIRRWQVEHTEFCEATVRGKDIPDRLVQNTLYQCARGYAQPHTKIEFKRIVKTSADGTVTETYEPMTYEYIDLLPPSVTAQLRWLGARMPGIWRERTDHGITIDPNSPFERMLARIDGESRTIPV